MILSGPTRIRLKGPFPDSTLRSNGELRDNNQVQVALVLYLLDRENNRREAVVGLGECVYISLSVQIIRYGLRIR